MSGFATTRARLSLASIALGLAGLVFFVGGERSTAATGDHPAGAAAGPAWLNIRLSFQERAAAIVSRMTLDEKALQLSTTNAPAIPRLGIQSYSYWNESQHGVYYLQATDPVTGQPRWFNRVVAPSFPTNLSASLTWNPALVQRQASAIGDEVRGFNDPDLFGEAGSNLGESPDNYGSLFHFNPTVNLQRDPRWGRTDEAFGEDPFLVGRLAGAYVDGFQGTAEAGEKSGRYLKAVSTLKHYALNNVEADRTAISSDTDETTIRDYYTAQFRTLIEDHGATGLMSAYNSVNGTPAVADSFLLNVLARRSWGFRGYVSSDCGAVATTYRRPDEVIGPGGPLALSGHDWSPPGWSSDGGGVDAVWTSASSGATVSGKAGGQALSLRAGTDLNCAGGGGNSTLFRSWFGNENDPEYIREAIASGLLGEGTIDRALLRVFTLRMRTGEFDPPGRVPFTRIGKEAINSPAHRRLTQTVAEQAIVLLRNAPVEGTGPTRKLLPADPASTDRVVVLGDLGGTTTLGGYSGIPTENSSPADGITDYIQSRNPGAVVTFDPAGTSTTGTGPAVLGDDTLEAIAEADLVLVVAGTDQSSNAEGSDRESIDLAPPYRSLIEQVSELAGGRTALYLQASGPVSLDGLEDAVPAILYSGPNGQRQGLALARTMFGENNPSGRLSFTWYRNDSQLPPIEDYDLTPGETGGLGRTYRYFRGDPQYAFGHGLSYSAFTFSRVRIRPSGRPAAAVKADGSVRVSFTVANRGPAPGATVAQVYAGNGGAVGGRALPRKRLVGFLRVAGLKPGERRSIVMHIPVERLRLFDPRLGRDVVYNGSYRFELGRSSDSIIAARKLRVRGRLGREVRHVTLQPEGLVLRKGRRLELRSANRWIADTTGGTYRETAQGTVEAVRADQSFVNLDRVAITYKSNRPAVASVSRRGVVTAVRPGIVTVSATVGGRRGSTVLVVTP
jgi:beta-glucosidase-like glycosyl hydrolase